ncbi:MAG: extracellular solute-binding protein [Chloroflexota bacterium]
MLSRRAFLTFLGITAVAMPLLQACGGGTAAGTASLSNATSATVTAAPTSSSSALASSSSAIATSSTAVTNSALAASTTPATTSAAGTISSAAASTVTATSAATAASAAATAPGGAEKTLTIWFDYGGGGMFAYQDVTAAFNKKYPAIKATATQVSGYKDKRLTAIASNTLQGAWVWLTYGWELPEFAQKNLLRPLDSFIASDKVNMQDFWPIVLTDTTYNGKNYAMTNHPAVVILWQNTDLAKGVGLDTAKPPATWDDLMTATQKLTQRAGNTFTQIGNDPTSTPYATWGAFWMAANGIPLLSDDGKKATFNGSPAQESLNYVIKTMDQVYGGPAPLAAWNKAATDKNGPFAAGKAGLATNGNWMAWNVGQEKTPAPFTIDGIPGGSNNAGKQYIPQLGVFNCVPLAATDPDSSWTYANYFASKEGQITMQLRSEDVPGNIAAAEDPASVKVHYGRSQVLDLFKAANALVYVRTPAYDAVNKALGTLSSDSLNKKTDVATALAAAQQQVQAALDAYWSGK